MVTGTSRHPAQQVTASPGLLGEALARVVGTLDAVVKSEVQKDPFQRDPRFVAQLFPLLKAVRLFFSTEFSGWNHVPKNQPCLIVGNHSGGAGTNDFAFLLYKWVDALGPEAPLYSLTYDFLFATPVINSMLRRLGAIPANHANARKALSMGGAVAVFPGGDYEVFRPWSQRNRIDFGARMGFASLAISTGVPVVPMTIHGAHQSTLVFTRGQQIARLAGFDRMHVNVFPLIWNIPLGITPAFVPSLQLPAKVEVHFGSPLDWSSYGARRAHDPRVLDRCYREITEVMQKSMNRLARRTPYPVLKRLRELELGHMAVNLQDLVGMPPARRVRR